MSPLAEKRWPSRSDSASPFARERSRISVEPSVPAPARRCRAVDACRRCPRRPGARGGARARSAPSLALATWRTAACVKSSAPWRAASAQIGERHRGLGADVAAPAAVAAAGAGGLRDARGVDAGLEAHRPRARHRLHSPGPCRPLASALYFVSVGGARIALRAAASAPRGVKPSSSSPSCAIWPGHTASANTRAIGAQRHAGVDQRAAAEPAADEHVHVLAEAHVVERRGGARCACACPSPASRSSDRGSGSETPPSAPRGRARARRRACPRAPAARPPRRRRSRSRRR